MTYIINVNEITVFQLIFLALFRRNPYVLAVDPLFPLADRVLQPIVNWTISSGRAQKLIDQCPELDHIKDRFSEVYLYNIFEKTEAWQNNFFDFENADRMGEKHALAYKNITTKFISTRYLQILTLDRALAKLGNRDIRVTGLSSAILGALKAFANEPIDIDIKPSCRLFFPAVNFIFAVMNIFYSWFWILSRLRPQGVKRELFFLAVDYNGDQRDIHLCAELSDGGPILLVIRNLSHNPEEEEVFKTYASCKPTDGCFTPLGALNALGFVLLDVVRLFLKSWRQEPTIFFQLARLPYRRAVMRALFTRFEPQFFWGRDDYNPEHIIRHQELTRIGKRSFGITHGFATYCDRAPSFCYISFDKYYVFGKINYQLYKDTWGKDISVTPVGSFGALREDYAFISETKPKDIVFFTGIFTNYPQLVEIVRHVAKEFPERTIWIQVKGNYANLSRGIDFVKSCLHEMSNIRLASKSIFENFRLARYAFSDPSTAVIEALQFGLTSFMLDISDIHEACPIRDFPDICITSADEAVERIRSIENETWRYPRETFADLIDLSGQVFFDVIRKDMGLPLINEPRT